MLKRKPDDDDGAFSNNGSEGQPVALCLNLLLVMMNKTSEIDKKVSRDLRTCSNRLVATNHDRALLHSLKTN
jgi:hypothetical protein